MDEMIIEIRNDLSAIADLQVRATLQRFFKEEVQMYGIKSGAVRAIAKKYLAQIRKGKLPKTATFELCEQLWASTYQEEAIIACMFTQAQKKFFTADDFVTFERWIQMYVTNWATCDTFCNHSVGDLLMAFPDLAEGLLDWAVSDNRWLKRAAAVSLILPARNGQFIPLAFQIADVLLLDQDDLVQKGYGWLLKSAAEVDQLGVFSYVMQHKQVMPRTALRYAIEKMPKDLVKLAMSK